MSKDENDDSLKDLEQQLQRLQKQLQQLREKQLASKPAQGRWWIGNETSTDEVIAKVHETLSNRPRTLQELSEITGVAPARLSGAIVRLQVTGVVVRNLGTKYRALWWIPRSSR